ncbi:MAG: hypothetical protein ILP19_00790 [Oscillospiraceae bacterium]|nr:hypothetical protein [Oscillospiraceae bacterium]
MRIERLIVSTDGYNAYCRQSFEVWGFPPKTGEDMSDWPIFKSSDGTTVAREVKEFSPSSFADKDIVYDFGRYRYYRIDVENRYIDSWSSAENKEIVTEECRYICVFDRTKPLD